MCWWEVWREGGVVSVRSVEPREMLKTTSKKRRKALEVLLMIALYCDSRSRSRVVVVLLAAVEKKQ